jgi:hypothetical protein
MAFNVGSCVVIDSSRNVNAGVGTFTGLNAPPVPIEFSPADGATGINVITNIIITFNFPVVKGTGNITIRSGSAGGTVLQTINVTNATVTISGAVVTIDPPSDLLYVTDTYVVVDAGAFKNAFNSTVDSPIINTYNFTTFSPPLGSSYEGGTLICCASPIRWVVSPCAAQVSRDWYSRGDANTRAQQVSGCTGWFVPSNGQYQNPGHTCRTFWSPPNARHWSNTQQHALEAFTSNPFNNANYLNATNDRKPTVRVVRSFRCVTY